MAWGLFFRSLEEGIVAAKAVAVVTLPRMTTRGEAVAREKDRASYLTLFRDLEGCCSYVRDVGYRTPNGRWLAKSVLNSLLRGIGDLPTTMMMTSGGKGEGSGRTLTADSDDFKYNNKCNDSDNNNSGSPLQLFVWEGDLLSVTPAKMNIGIIRLHAPSQLPPSSSPPSLSLSCQCILFPLASPSSSPASSISTAELTDPSSTIQCGQRTKRSPLVPD
jgi:hypothetical protein